MRDFKWFKKNLTNFNPFAALFRWKSRAYKWNKCFYILFINYLAEVFKIWNLWTFFRNQFPKSFNCYFIKFVLGPFEPIFASLASFFRFKVGKSASNYDFLGFRTESDCCADIKSFDVLFDPLKNRRKILFDDCLAKWIIRSWECCTKLFNEGCNFFFNCLVF